MILNFNLISLAMIKDSYTAGRDGSCDIVFVSDMFTHGNNINAVSKLHFRIVRVCISQIIILKS